MARKQLKKQLEISSHPQWETHILETYPDGRIRCVPDRSVWLVRELPQASVPDAETVAASVAVGRPLEDALYELAEMAVNPVRRIISKGGYREVLIHWVNIPKPYTADPKNPIAAHLNAQFGEMDVYVRKAILAVKLIPTLGVAKGGVMERAANAIDSFVESARERKGAPLADFDRDAAFVSMALARAGLEIPDDETMKMADSWFNYGRAESVPIISHPDHIHFFRTPRDAYRAYDASPRDCDEWPDDISEHALTFATVKKFTMKGINAGSSLSRWVLALTENKSEARCIAIRGLVEPAKMTRLELQSQHAKYEENLKELQAAGKITKVEFDQRMTDLATLTDEYAYNESPTLIEADIIIAFSGIVDDITKVQPPGVELSPMMNKQKDAFASIKIGSPVRTNPSKLEPSAALIAYSGLLSLSEGGDPAHYGTLIGFSEHDRQPVYISPAASYEGDAHPLMAIYGDTGAGKTVLLQSMALGLHKLRTPQLIVNPKPDSSMKDTLVNGGAHHMTLSELEGTGLLDTFNTFENPVEASSNAYAMLDAVNPFGNVDEWNSLSTAMLAGLRYGAFNGAKATGQALMMAVESKKFDLPRDAVEKIFQAAEASPLFGASFAIEPTHDRFRLGDGTLLVEVGNSAFRRPPEDGAEVKYNTNLEIRASVNLLRTLVWAGAGALRHRGGVIHIDESWMLEKADPNVLDELGRLMRSWAVSLWLYTQKATPHLEMGLKSYISRALIGHLKDPIEARAAMDLFGFTNQRMASRITAKQYGSGGKVLNPESLHARFVPDPSRPGKKIAERGSVFYVVDLKGRGVPTEVKLSEEFLWLASSTPEVVAERRRQEALMQAAAVA